MPVGVAHPCVSYMLVSLQVFCVTRCHLVGDLAAAVGGGLGRLEMVFTEASGTCFPASLHLSL